MSEKTITLTDDNFKTEVLDHKGVVLIDFWAPWCAPCKALTPSVEIIAEEYEGKVKVGKINVDNNPATPAQYNVRGIPMLVVIKNGQTVDLSVGVVPVQQIRKMLDKHL